MFLCHINDSRARPPPLSFSAKAMGKNVLGLELKYTYVYVYVYLYLSVDALNEWTCCYQTAGGVPLPAATL